LPGEREVLRDPRDPLGDRGEDGVGLAKEKLEGVLVRCDDACRVHDQVELRIECEHRPVDARERVAKKGVEAGRSFSVGDPELHPVEQAGSGPTLVASRGALRSTRPSRGLCTAPVAPSHFPHSATLGTSARRRSAVPQRRGCAIGLRW